MALPRTVRVTRLVVAAVSWMLRSDFDDGMGGEVLCC